MPKKILLFLLIVPLLLFGCGSEDKTISTPDDSKISRAVPTGAEKIAIFMKDFESSYFEKVEQIKNYDNEFLKDQKPIATFRFHSEKTCFSGGGQFQLI